MKIAIASDDGATIASHFGRSTCFIVFEIEGDKMVGREVRPNTFTPHARGECTGQGQVHGHGSGHAAILAALHDCQSVVCYGMGGRAAQDLKAQGIEPLVLAAAMAPEQAMESYLRGDLKLAGGFCRCHE